MPDLPPRMPEKDEYELAFVPLQDIRIPNRQGKGGNVKFGKNQMRRIGRMDYDLYGRVVNWWLQGMVEFRSITEKRKPGQAQPSGSAKVED